jgi:hypothetical protein
MMKHLTAAAAGVAAMFAAAGPVMATETFTTMMSGYEEAATQTVSTTGKGAFFAVLNDAGTSLDYTLFYTNLESPISQSHIHFGAPAINGGVVMFLCVTNQTPAGVPLPKPCVPGTSGVVTGTLTAADVGAGAAAQGIAAGEYAEIIRAMRAGAAYANVHTTNNASGEIRGQIQMR